MDITSLKKDASAITQGQWVSDIPNMGTGRLRVRGLTSPLVSAYLDQRYRAATPDQRDRAGELKPDTRATIFKEALRDVVLLEWDGFTSEGKPLPYSADVAGKYLTDPNFEALADAVTWAARVVDRGLAATTEALEKN